MPLFATNPLREGVAGAEVRVSQPSLCVAVSAGRRRAARRPPGAGPSRSPSPSRRCRSAARSTPTTRRTPTSSASTPTTSSTSSRKVRTHPAGTNTLIYGPRAQGVGTGLPEPPLLIFSCWACKFPHWPRGQRSLLLSPTSPSRGCQTDQGSVTAELYT